MDLHFGMGAALVAAVHMVIRSNWSSNYAFERTVMWRRNHRRDHAAAQRER